MKPEVENQTGSQKGKIHIFKDIIETTARMKMCIYDFLFSFRLHTKIGKAFFDTSSSFRDIGDKRSFTSVREYILHLYANPSTYDLAAAMLDFPLPVWSDSNKNNLKSHLSAGLENLCCVIGILFLFHLEAEIWLFPFLRPPYRIFHFRCRLTSVQLVPSASLKFGVDE